MNDAAITTAILITTIVVLVGWDVYVAFFNRESNADDTISGIALKACRSFWGLPFAAGVLLGHLFVPAASPYLESEIVGAVILVAASLLIGAVGWLTRRFGVRGPGGWAFLIIVFGVTMGHVFWPQVR